MEQKQFTYIIGSKNFVQRPLTYGQLNQLMKSLRGFVMPADLDPLSILASLGSRLPHVLAVVLLEEAAVVNARSREDLKLYLKHRDLDALAEELEFDLDIETPLRVVRDFFDVNPTASISELLIGLMESVRGLMPAKTPSKKISAS